MRAAVTVSRLFAIVLMFALPAMAPVAAAQDDGLEKQLETVAGLQADAASTFFDALRKNVGRDDRKAACGMIAYPLRQSAGDVKDAATCEARYDSIFTIAVRKAIGRQQYEELFVNQSGVMVGLGELWFAGRCTARPCRLAGDIKITAINPDPRTLQPPKGKVLLACFVSGQRIQVSADGQGGTAFRMWRLPRRSGLPDLEIPAAQPSSAPANPCGSRSWTFTDGTRTYVVTDLPCDAYLSPPPMGSVGRVTLSTQSSPGVPLWCAE